MLIEMLFRALFHKENIVERYTLGEKEVIRKQCRFLDGFKHENVNERIARGDEPIPGGFFARKEKKNIIMEDDYLNAIQKNLYLVRAYWITRVPKETEQLTQYDTFLRENNFVYHENSENGSIYYEAYRLSKEDIEVLEDKIKEYGYKINIKAYDYIWCRGDLYRTRFYRYNQMKEVNRCVYCGKRVYPGAKVHPGEERMEVDHIIPVAKLMNNEKMLDGTSYRDFAQVLGINRADSPRNLVASCHRCNSSKRTRTKGYIRRAMFLQKRPWIYDIIFDLGKVLIIIVLLFAWYLLAWK